MKIEALDRFDDILFTFCPTGMEVKTRCPDSFMRKDDIEVLITVLFNYYGSEIFGPYIVDAFMNAVDDVLRKHLKDSF